MPFFFNSSIYLASELRVSPEEHPVLITDEPLAPRSQREKLTQILFEVFSVPALYVTSAPTLALYSYGRNSGVVVSIGDGITFVVPVFEGVALAHAITRVDIGGRNLTDYVWLIFLHLFTLLAHENPY